MVSSKSLSPSLDGLAPKHYGFDQLVEGSQLFLVDQLEFLRTKKVTLISSNNILHDCVFFSDEDFHYYCIDCITESQLLGYNPLIIRTDEERMFVMFSLATVGQKVILVGM